MSNLPPLSRLDLIHRSAKFKSLHVASSLLFSKMNLQESGTAPSFSDGTVEKVPSNTTWNCGLTCPVEIFNMREKFPAWTGDLPTYAPTLTRLSHFRIKLAPCRRASSMYTGQPNVWKFLIFILLCVALKFSARDFPDFLRRRLIKLNSACFNVKVQRPGCITSGHQCFVINRRWCYNY